MNKFRRILLFALLAFTAIHVFGQTNGINTNAFSFIIAGDMRNYIEPLRGGQEQFGGACAAIKQAGPGAFIIIPGDFDPPAPVRATLDQYIGTKYISYFAVGNHDVESADNLQWIRRWAAAGIPHLVRSGPAGSEATTYSFDFGNSHFVVLSDYFDGQKEAHNKAGLSDATLQWLADDLAATHQPLIWLASHMPLECLPDMDSGRGRHAGDSLVPTSQQRARFTELVHRYHVLALICGHTHNCSIAKLDGLWQLDSGHARGAGDAGAPSTFLKVRVAGDRAWVDVFRADADGKDYRLRKTVELN
jgi:hypothetical protein